MKHILLIAIVCTLAINVQAIDKSHQSEVNFMNYLLRVHKIDKAFYNGLYRIQETNNLFKDMNILEKTYLIELWKYNLEYCLQNKGKLVSIKIYNTLVLYEKDNIINNRVIGVAYSRYGVLDSAEKYFYKEWQEPGNMAYPSLLMGLISYLEGKGRYKQALKYYPELVAGYVDVKTHPELLLDENINAKKYREVLAPPKERVNLNIYLDGWEKCEENAKTKQPDTLETVFTMHHWFYSGEKDKVMQSLEYYRNNDVEFMLEKGRKDKDAEISATAVKYLEEVRNKKKLEIKDKK